MCDLELTADRHIDCTSSLCSTEPHGNQVNAFLQPCLATGSILPNFWANYDQDKQDIPTWAQNVSLAPPPSLPSLPDWPGFPARPSLVLSPDWTSRTLLCYPEKPACSCLEGFTWFLLQAPWSEQNTGMLTSFQQSSPPRTFCYYMDCIVYWDQAVEYVFGLFTAFGDTISTHIGFQSPRTFYSHFFFLPSGETRISGVHRPQFMVLWSTGSYPVKGWVAFGKDLCSVLMPEKCTYAPTLTMLQQVNKLPNILPGSRTPAQVQAHLYFQLAHEPPVPTTLHAWTQEAPGPQTILLHFSQG